MIQHARLLSRVEIGTAAVLSLVALALSYRFCTEAGPLWRDEVSTIQLATLPRYADVLASLRFDSAPALYPTALRSWVLLWGGSEDLQLRIFGLLVGVAAIGALWTAARGLTAGAPMLTLALFALHPGVLQTLGSLKPYGLGAIFLALAFCAIGRLVARPTTSRAVCAAVAAILAVQTVYTNAPLLVGPFAAGIAVKAMSRDWKAARLVLVTGTVAALSLVPYAGVVLASLEWRPLNEIQPSLGLLGRQIVAAFGGGSLTLLIVWVVVCLAAMCTAVLAWRARDGGSPGTNHLVYAAVTLVITTVGYAVFLRFVARNAEPWHLVPLMIVVTLCLDVIVRRPFAFGGLRLALVAIAAVVLIPMSARWVGVRQTNVDHLAVYVSHAARPGDAIVVTPWFVGITFNRYYHGPVPWLTIPPIDDLRIHRYDLLKRRMSSTQPLAPVYRAMTSALESGHRIWLVGGLEFPERNEVVVPLPPAPTSPSGWNDAPYYHAWSREAGRFVLDRALRVGVVRPRDDQPVWSAEDVVLLVAEGWRGNAGR